MDNLKHIEKAIDYIETNLENNITVAAVAGSAAYSYSHFGRMFEMVVGESIGGYVRSRRLSKAAEYLLYTDKRIIDIAMMLRFESHEAFGRAFKRMFYVTPSQYRKNGIDTLLGRKNPLDALALKRRQGISLEPEIVTLPHMLLVGMRFPISPISSGINLTAEKWRSFAGRMGEIPNAAQSDRRYCFYEAHDHCTYDTLDTQVLTTAFIGVEVKSLLHLPHGMVSKDFAGGKYAHFIHAGSVVSLIDAYRYIWGTWIPYNRVELADGDDIERFTDRFQGEDNEKSETDIFFPIR